MSEMRQFLAGAWVEVRPREEILRTLDGHARLDGLPFMPQMLAYCGRRFRIAKRAHKFCDTVNGTGARHIGQTVLLEAPRCDGAAFGGCEMRCVIFWKEAWLKPVDGPASPAPATEQSPQVSSPGPPTCTERDVWSAARRRDADGEPTYSCQATQLPYASTHLGTRAVRQYLEDYTSGNARLGEIVSSLLRVGYHQLAEAGIGLGSAMRGLYDAVQKIRQGGVYPYRPGQVPRGAPTPTVKLDVQPGEMVRVKSHREILATVNDALQNRGMSFHPEMARYCGQTFRVLMRVGRIIDERTGHLKILRNECVVLDGADCLGHTTKPLLCPRGCYPYWREAWIERARGRENSALSAIDGYARGAARSAMDAGARTENGHG